MTTEVPLILTLALDNDSQQYFNQLRQQHFPPRRNYLDAHLTLFHHLPKQPQLFEDIELAAATYAPMALHIPEIKSIGSGVAYKIDCPLLLQLHGYLQKLWQPYLIPQDRQKLWPHITVQNKVTAEQAALLKLHLEKEFTPLTATGIGLNLYAYQGGPWDFVRSFTFTG